MSGSDLGRVGNYFCFRPRGNYHDVEYLAARIGTTVLINLS